jgi:hypothetical protein
VHGIEEFTLQEMGPKGPTLERFPDIKKKNKINYSLKKKCKGNKKQQKYCILTSRGWLKW